MTFSEKTAIKNWGGGGDCAVIVFKLLPSCDQNLQPTKTWNVTPTHVTYRHVWVTGHCNCCVGFCVKELMGKERKDACSGKISQSFYFFPLFSLFQHQLHTFWVKFAEKNRKQPYLLSGFSYTMAELCLS